MNYYPFPSSIQARIKAGYRLIIGAALLASVPAAQSAIQFEDLTGDAGFSYLGRSWGAAWGDYDGDGLVDLWVPNHLSPPELFRNRGDGTFENVTTALVPPEVLLEHDMHGSAWADFDNDGDLDLLQSVGADFDSSGSAGPKLLLVNEGGAFTERAADYGLEYLEGRGRMLLWLDADNDGWLDVYYSARASGNTNATAALFRQQALGFEDVTISAGVTPESTRGTNYAMLADIDGTGGLELLVDDKLKFPVKVLETEDFPLNDIFQNLAPAPKLKTAQDAAIADLDGDLDNDIYTVSGPRNSNVVLAQPNVLEGHFGPEKNSERGITFETAGDVLFDFRWLKKDQWSLTDIRIGSSGYSPSRIIPTLSAQDPTNHGIFPHTPGVNKGIYVGYDPTAEEWVFLVSTPLEVTDFVITSDATIEKLTPVAWDPDELPNPDFYYINDGAGFNDETEQRGIDLPSAGRSIVAGDFDNDMDLDLYIVSTGPVQNLPNTLYENQGNGQFVKVANGGGAAGTIDGRGDAVAMADYDADGYLDLFVTNGKSRRPFEEDGPVQLFHNTGSGNHWLQLDLEGVQSNRDGIGARIELTAGGVTQLREQNAGIHARAQNQMRVHFGLGPNTQADQLVIQWPSGVRQEIENIVANQVVKITELVEPSVLGQPDMSGAEGGVYLWKWNESGPYRLRVKSNEKSTFVVKLVSSEPLIWTRPKDLNGNDVLTVTSHGFSLRSNVNGHHDGINFKLPAGARAMLSVERDGIANPRQLHVGEFGAPLSPVGWIKPVRDWPLRPPFVTGSDLGLFAGRGAGDGVFEAHWSGDGPNRSAGVILTSSQAIEGITPISLEADDTLLQTSGSVEVDGRIGPHEDEDAVNLALDPDSDVGLVYRQDNFVAPDRVNRNSGMLGVPNAYWLQLTGP